MREMRRSRQLLGEAETLEILDRGSHGVLALIGDGGYPYALPISYAREGDRLYMHCAKAGHKLDALRAEPRASFCVVARDEVVPEEFTTRYRSAIAFGRIHELAGEEDILRALRLLCAKYCPGIGAEAVEAAIAREFAGVNVLEFKIERLSGKQARELIEKGG